MCPVGDTGGAECRRPDPGWCRDETYLTGHPVGGIPGGTERQQRRWRCGLRGEDRWQSCGEKLWQTDEFPASELLITTVTEVQFVSLNDGVVVTCRADDFLRSVFARHG